MSVDTATVAKIAALARIKLGEAEIAAMVPELNGILAWIEQLNEVDVEGVDAMTTPVAMTLPMREDVVSDGNIRDKVLANAPRTEDGFFVVPKVVE